MMKTRLFAIGALLGFVAIMAPVASAQYCLRCPTYPTPHCVNAIRVIGYPECIPHETYCDLIGDPCDPPGSRIAAPLASEFTVTAVERIEPSTVAPEPLPATTPTSR